MQECTAAAAAAKQHLHDLQSEHERLTGELAVLRELVATFKDLSAAGCQILTIGQYLRPSPAHAPMIRYYHPDEFHDLKQVAIDLGFVQVESGPLVRSSYHAGETADAYVNAAR